MAGTTEFTIGAEARCTDGACGEVKRVVIDPVARTVTHLVIEPKHRPGLGLGRLVPLSVVDADGGAIRLRCTLLEFGQLDPAEETQFLPGASGYSEYGPGQAYLWPYFGLGGGMPGGLPDPNFGLGMGSASIPTIHDNMPLGEVAVRRDEQVHATDGDIGRVQGLVIDLQDHHVTHVLLQEGHLWGRKQVAIPIGAVTSVHDGIRLNITKHQVQCLPSVDIHHLHG